MLPLNVNSLKPIKFKSGLKRYKLYNVEIGGYGENPTLLIGSLFYHGDRKVMNHNEGVFDKKATKNEIESTMQVCGEYGIPCAIDVVATTGKAMEKYIPFISDVYDGLIFVDGVSPEARIRGYELVSELGLHVKAIANGIYPGMPDEELNAIKNNRIEAVVLLAYDPRNPSTFLSLAEKLKVVKEVLLPMAQKVNAAKILIDSIVLDIATITIAASSITYIKNELGYPTGSGPANVLGVVTTKLFGKEGVSSIHTAISVYLRIMGADFIMYGPLRRAKYIIPGLAMIDGLLGYVVRREGVKVSKEHPLYKVVKNVQRLFLKST